MKITTCKIGEFELTIRKVLGKKLESEKLFWIAGGRRLQEYLGVKEPDVIETDTLKEACEKLKDLANRYLEKQKQLYGSSLPYQVVKEILSFSTFCEGNEGMFKNDNMIELAGLSYQVSAGIASSILCIQDVSKGNDEIFNRLGLNKEEFTNETLGYCSIGQFPVCKSLEDLNIMILALQAEAINQGKQTITNHKKEEITMLIKEFPDSDKVERTHELSLSSYRLHINKACKDWQDKLFNLWGRDLLSNGFVNVKESLIAEMYKAAADNKELKDALRTCFPKYNIIYVKDLKVSEALKSKKGIIYLRPSVLKVELKHLILRIDDDRFSIISDNSADDEYGEKITFKGLELC